MVRAALCLSLFALCSGMTLRAEDDANDKLMQGIVKTMQTLGETLTTVKDKATLDAAAPKIQECMKDLKASFEEVKKLGEEVSKGLADKYKDQGKPAKEKINAELERISKDADLGAAVNKLME